MFKIIKPMKLYMDECIISFLNECGIKFSKMEDLDDVILDRIPFLSKETYEKMKPRIPDMKKQFSSSSLTSLHKTAETNQKWPLLNLVRQILRVYRFKMLPVRRANGSDETGKKRYKRFFKIKQAVKKDITPV